MKTVPDNDEVRHAFMNAIGPWGRIVDLVSSPPNSPPSHLVTDETMVLLAKVKDFWQAIEDSLQVVHARPKLFLVKPGPGEG